MVLVESWPYHWCMPVLIVSCCVFLLGCCVFCDCTQEGVQQQHTELPPGFFCSLMFIKQKQQFVSLEDWVNGKACSDLEGRWVRASRKLVGGASKHPMPVAYAMQTVSGQCVAASEGFCCS